MVDSERRAGDEMEVTPAMVEAGDAELVFPYGLETSDRGRAEVLIRVFRAMLSAAPPAALVQTPSPGDASGQAR